MVYLNRDLTDVDPDDGFKAIPAGKYTALITNSELVHTKDNDARLLFTWCVLNGEYADRLVFGSLMLSGKGMEMGDRNLKKIAIAVGHPNPNLIDETEDLHGVPCQITVGFGKGDYSDRNDIKDYKPLPANTAMAPPAASSAPPARQQPAPPAANSKTPPPPRRNTAPPPPNQAPPKAATPFDPPPEAYDDDGPY